MAIDKLQLGILRDPETHQQLLPYTHYTGVIDLDNHIKELTTEAISSQSNNRSIIRFSTTDYGPTLKQPISTKKWRNSGNTNSSDLYLITYGSTSYTVQPVYLVQVKWGSTGNSVTYANYQPNKPTLNVISIVPNTESVTFSLHYDIQTYSDSDYTTKITSSLNGAVYRENVFDLYMTFSHSWRTAEIVVLSSTIGNYDQTSAYPTISDVLKLYNGAYSYTPPTTSSDDKETFQGTVTATTSTLSTREWSDSKYLQLTGGTMSGGITMNNYLLKLRTYNDSYDGGIGWDTNGNEALCLWAKNSVTRLRWYAGVTPTDPTTSGWMMGITPDFEVKKVSNVVTGYLQGKEIIHEGNFNTKYPDLNAIEELSDISGFLEKTDTNTWRLHKVNYRGVSMVGTLGYTKNQVVDLSDFFKKLLDKGYKLGDLIQFSWADQASAYISSGDTKVALNGASIRILVEPVWDNTSNDWSSWSTGMLYIQEREGSIKLAGLIKSSADTPESTYIRSVPTEVDINNLKNIYLPINKFYAAQTNAGWYRIYEGNTTSRTKSLLFTLFRTWNATQGETYTYQINIVKSVPVITQLSGTFSTHLITKIRVIVTSETSSGLVYIDCYYSGNKSNDICISGSYDPDGNFIKPKAVDASVDSSYTVTEYNTIAGHFFSNSITASSFIKSGGTSSQFLKANGSVDSNTYLTKDTETKLTTVTTAGTGNAVTSGSISTDGKTLTLKRDTSFLPLTGGKMTGQLQFSGSAAIASDANPSYLVSMKSFSDGGNLTWTSVSDLKTVLGLSNFLPLTGSTFTNGLLTANGLTGSIGRDYRTASTNPFLYVGSNNQDVTLLRVYSSDSQDTDNYLGMYGYSLKYLGTKTGVNNILTLFADNQNGTSQVEAISINQSGQVGIKTAPNTSHALTVQGSIFRSDVTNHGFLKSDGSIDTTAYTSNNGTVTSVRVQGSGPIKSSTSTEQTVKLNTTISLDTFTLTAQGDSGWSTAANRTKIPDMSFIAYWNGAYNGQSSNLTYCSKGKFGDLCKVNYPSSNQSTTYLRGDGWATFPTIPSYSTVSTSSAGLVPQIPTSSSFDGTEITSSDLLLMVKGTDPNAYTPKWVKLPGTAFEGGTSYNVLSSSEHLSTANYVVKGSGYSGTASKFLREDGTWQTVSTSSGSTYTLPVATSNALGGIKIGYSTSGKNYAVQLDSNNRAYVNVPWTSSSSTYVLTSNDWFNLFPVDYTGGVDASKFAEILTWVLNNAEDEQKNKLVTLLKKLLA